VIRKNAAQGLDGAFEVATRLPLEHLLHRIRSRAAQYQQHQQEQRESCGCSAGKRRSRAASRRRGGFVNMRTRGNRMACVVHRRIIGSGPVAAKRNSTAS
jgi:hypothetical protein